MYSRFDKPILSILILAFITTSGFAGEKLSPEEGNKRLGELAVIARIAASQMTFDEFKSSKFVYKEPFEGGKFIVNGDTPIATEKELNDFFKHILEAVNEILPEGKLAVYNIAGKNIVWNETDKNNLTYCISNDFEERKSQVVAAMDTATTAWESVADIDFKYALEEDANCNQFNNSVNFDIRPVSSGAYLARAFFPNDSRIDRNILVDLSAFSTSGELTLIGIMRHELGHTIGLRHEHTRPDAGQCFEDDNWSGVTNYDPFSVMHYPQCNGKGDWSLALTELDKHGAACLYGAASEFAIDYSFCENVTGLVIEK